MKKKHSLKALASALVLLTTCLTGAIGVSAEISVYEADVSIEDVMSTMYEAPVVAADTTGTQVDFGTVDEFYADYSGVVSDEVPNTQADGTEWMLYDTKTVDGQVIYTAMMGSEWELPYATAEWMHRYCVCVDGVYIAPCVDFKVNKASVAGKISDFMSVTIADVYGVAVGVSPSFYKNTHTDWVSADTSECKMPLAIPPVVTKQFLNETCATKGFSADTILGMFTQDKSSNQSGIYTMLRAYLDRTQGITDAQFDSYLQSVSIDYVDVNVFVSDALKGDVWHSSNIDYRLKNDYLPVKKVDFNQQFKATVYSGTSPVHFSELWLSPLVEDFEVYEGIADSNTKYNEINYGGYRACPLKAVKVATANDTYYDKAGVLIKRKGSSLCIRNGEYTPGEDFYGIPNACDTLVYYPLGKAFQQCNQYGTIVVNEAPAIGTNALDMWGYVEGTSSQPTISNVIFDVGVITFDKGVLTNVYNPDCKYTVIAGKADASCLLADLYYKVNDFTEMIRCTSATLDISQEAVGGKYQDSKTTSDIRRETDVCSYMICEPIAMDELKLTKSVNGDADMSGSLGIADIVAVRKYLLASELYGLTVQGLTNADVNEDNQIDALDTSILVEANLGCIKL